MKNISIVTKVAPDAGEGSTHTYTYTDETPFQGTSYYRLKQIDVDGKTTTYPWRPVVVNHYYTIFPNPTRAKQFHLRLDEPGNAVIRIYDMSGRSVLPRVRTNNSEMVEVKLPDYTLPGAYLLHVTERGKSHLHRLVVD